MKFHLVTLLLALALLAAGCAPPAPLPSRPGGESPGDPQSLAPPGEEETLEVPPPSLYGRSFLAGEALALYDDLARALADGRPGSLPLPPGLEDLAALEVADRLQGDDPMAYWARFRVEAQGGERSLVWASDYTPEEIARRRGEIEARRDEILLPVREAEPFQKALAIHDAMAAVPYDRTEGADSGNVYGALVGGKAFCNGYAAGFQYLATQAGLESVYLRGRSARGVPHAWNALMLDGAWHFVDPTWDRPTSVMDEIYHDYFLVSWEELQSDHIWDETQYPALPQTGGPGFACYYTRMGYQVAGEPPEDAGALLAEILYRQLLVREDYPPQSAPVFLEFKVTDDSYPAWKRLCIQELFSIVGALEARAQEEGRPFRIGDSASAKMNFNDNLQVVTLYPYVQAND